MTIRRWGPKYHQQTKPPRPQQATIYTAASGHIISIMNQAVSVGGKNERRREVQKLSYACTAQVSQILPIKPSRDLDRLPFAPLALVLQASIYLLLKTSDIPSSPHHTVSLGHVAPWRTKDDSPEPTLINPTVLTLLIIGISKSNIGCCGQ